MSHIGPLEGLVLDNWQDIAGTNDDMLTESPRLSFVHQCIATLKWKDHHNCRYVNTGSPEGYPAVTIQHSFGESFVSCEQYHYGPIVQWRLNRSFFNGLPNSVTMVSAGMRLAYNMWHNKALWKLVSGQAIMSQIIVYLKKLNKETTLFSVTLNLFVGRIIELTFINHNQFLPENSPLNVKDMARVLRTSSLIYALYFLSSR